jgi:hypothetical protein
MKGGEMEDVARGVRIKHNLDRKGEGEGEGERTVHSNLLTPFRSFGKVFSSEIPRCDYNDIEMLNLVLSACDAEMA